MRKSEPELSLHFGSGMFVEQAPGRRLETILKRLEFTLAEDDPIRGVTEDARLKVIFLRCIEGNVYKIPTAFKYIPQRQRMFCGH